MEKTIEIPEGYEARIEGNKVILIPKESENERIIEDIISLIKFALNDGSAVSPGSLTTKEEAIAYLEKQKEQKSIDIDFVFDWLRKHIKTYINSEYNEFHKTVEYDGSINIEHLIEDLKKAIEQQPIGEEYVIKIGKPSHTIRVGSQSDIDKLISQEKQEQPRVDLEEYIENEIKHYGLSLYEASYGTFSASQIDRIIRNAFELGLNTRKS